MFEKKDVIVSSTMGLCIVADITRLSADRKAPILYYVLKPYYDRSKTAYIPVEGHEVELREPEDRAAAEAYADELKKEFAADPEYVPDSMKVGEAAYVMGVSCEKFVKQAGAPEEENAGDDTHLS